MSKFKIDVYSDGAQIDDMRRVAALDFVTGFTTNPSLMKKAGITDYMTFAKQAVAEFPTMPLSFEVFSSDPNQMRKEADAITQLGDQVYVKVPIIRASGEDNGALIHDLASAGVKVNVTAITTIEQVQLAVDALSDQVKSIVSVFAGRVADTGVDPKPLMREAAQRCHQKANVQLLWASTREAFNVIEAQDLGCDIITVPPTILTKVAAFGKSAEQVSLDTVKTFDKDIASLGFSILPN